MGKVLPFTTRSVQKMTNKEIADKIMFQSVLRKMYEETGFDWLKLCTGDPHENIRFDTLLIAQNTGQEKNENSE
ncbi:hypothetical protein [Brevibacillus nitrificans]|uniref:hypothetical protein n=1 Tax=Brevibacillus nitrificans TaxID=651560 RepID=UPI000ACC829E|nr:hypothetical protein [Brevibacillus nitrificans]MDR7319650.1 hypothetical protein [Brevibacillus nitrificans]